MICGANSIEQDKSSDIASGLICPASGLQIKNKNVWVFVSGILPRNKGSDCRKYRFQRTKGVLKNRCRKTPGTRIKFDKEKCRTPHIVQIHLIEEAYKKLVSSIRTYWQSL